MNDAGGWASEAWRLVLVAAASLAILLLAEAARRSGRVSPEGGRKLTHFGVGVLAGAFPWIFASPVTVAVLTVASLAGLLVARRVRALPALYDVGRTTAGELYFPIAVAVLFALARHQPVFYLISIYTLVVCDAVAAILGKSYGRHSFLVTTDRKTLEGTAAFLVATFLGVELPLVLLTGLDRAACVLIAVQVALLVTSFEAISVRGIDNLVVPLGTFYLLVRMTSRSAESVGHALLVQLAILGVMLLLAWRTRFLTFSGALAAHLVLYACYALGSPRWIFAPAAALAAFLVLDAYAHRGPDPSRPAYHVAAIFHMSLTAMLFVFADNALASPLASARRSFGHPFYSLFVGALAASLAAGTYLALRTGPRVIRHRRGLRVAIALLVGFLVVVPAGLALERDSLRLLDVASAGLLCALSVAGFLILHRRGGEAVEPTAQLRYVSTATIVAACIVVPIYLMSLR